MSLTPSTNYNSTTILKGIIMKTDVTNKIQEIKDFMQEMMEYNSKMGRPYGLDSNDVTEVEQMLNDIEKTNQQNTVSAQG